MSADVEQSVRRSVDEFTSLHLAVNAASVMPDDRWLHLLNENAFERVLGGTRSGRRCA